MTTRSWLDGTDNWTTAADWSGGSVPTPSDDVVVAQGDPQVTAAISVHSIADYARIEFHNTGGSSIGGNVLVAGDLDIDATAGNGGSTMSIAGTLTIRKTMLIGNATSSGFTTITTAFLVNTGTLALNASAAGATYLNVQGAAGFGVAGTLTGNVSLSGSSVIRFSSGSISTVAKGASLALDGNQAFVAVTGSTTSNSALTGLATVDTGGSLSLANGSAVTTGSLSDSGIIKVDGNSGEGGSALSVGGTFSNDGTLQVGNVGLAATASVQVQTLRNRGTVTLTGTDSKQAVLAITSGSASLGTAGAISGSVSLSGKSLLQVASGQFTTVMRNATLSINGTQAFVADAGRLASNSALTGLSLNNGRITLNGGAAIAVAGTLTNNGDLELGELDDPVGGTVSVAGTFVNTGDVSIGSAVSSGTSGITAAHLRNTGNLFVGDPIGAHFLRNALVTITDVAGFGTAGAVTGIVQVFDGGRIQFNGGNITTVKADAVLQMNGGLLSIAGSTSSNSALTHLQENAGSFSVEGDEEVVATVSNFSNSGDMFVAIGGTFSTSLALTNTGTLQVGVREEAFEVSTVKAARVRNTGTIILDGETNSDSTDETQSLIVTSAAGTGTTGVLTGKIDLSGNTLLQFASGQIATIEGSLSLATAYAHVADSGSTTSNSALTGLKTVSGALTLDDGATLALTGSLEVTGTGTLALDPTTGGSSLSITGRLDNEGEVDIGAATLDAASVITATSLVNDGRLSLTGNGTALARLSVSATAGFGSAGTLTGDVSVAGYAVIQFASGSIATIAAGASLTLDGASAVVAVGGNTGSNSALSGLTTIDGTLTMRDGAVLVPTKALALDGTLVLDDTGAGGSIWSGLALDNEGDLRIGNAGMTSADDLAVTKLTNNGSIEITGGPQGQAMIYVGAPAGFGATGVLTGDIGLTGNALIAFASGGLTTIEGGASLSLSGAGARIGISGSTSTNSALTGLTRINGSLALFQGAAITTSAALTNTGTVGIDEAGGGSALTVGGRFDNEGTVTLGNAAMTSADVLSAGTLLNNGSISITSGAAQAQLAIAGSITNNGSLAFSGCTQTLAGGIGGVGTIDLYAGTTLELGGSVSAAQTILYGGADRLTLDHAATFAGSITGFAVSDTIDLRGFAASSSLSYAGSASGGVLTVTGGSGEAHLAFGGAYTTASFPKASDGTGGLLISHA